MKVRQHIPGFVENLPEEHEVTNLEELLELMFVARWKEEPAFHRFSVTRNYWANATTSPGDGRAEQMHILMVELEEGYKWWGIAYLSGDDSLEILESLPEWEPRRK